MTGTISRRATLGALAAAAAARPVAAQAWPSRPIRMVVPYPPGGASDIIARVMAGPMTEMLGQTVIVENRPGANGQIAAEQVARSAPDGYTIMMGNAGPNALSQALLGNRLPYDSVRDFSFISLVSAVPMAMAVHPSVPAANLQELLALARARPGEINYAQGGTGAAPHLTIENLASIAGVRFTGVGFRGGQLAMTAVVSGQIPIIIDTAPVVLTQVREGRLRGIAVTTLERVPLAPDIPTIAEQGFPGFEATSWGGIVAPPGLSAPVQQRLNEVVVAVMARPDIRETLARQGIQARSSTPEQFRDHVASEVRRWSQVVQQANIRPE
ncbi:MAG TPA: tripartite tricarboxylate transporter substrate binding protein [Acetobacteraceae bacterium]|nr:tripartite tricarboxylate transporter substrate binding protein [Acetobacteraceae bacterium]